MHRPLLLILLAALALPVAAADDCDQVLQTVNTMRDAREYFHCVATRMQEQAARPAPAPQQTTDGIPEGTILPWDAVIRDADGKPTGGYRAVPYGWQVCNGSNGTPDLTGRFLMGVDSISAAGETGGRATIGESGAHAHTGTTGITAGPDHSISCAGKCAGGRTAAHSHTIDIESSGAHSHGTSLPPYYKVLYICRVAAAP